VRDVGLLRSVARFVAERFPLRISLPLAVALVAAPLPRSSWASLPSLGAVGWLLLFAARASDDVSDLARDALRRPGRGLPSGRVSARALQLATALAWLLALLGSCLLSLRAGGLVLLAIVTALLDARARERLPPLVHPVLLNAAFAVLVLLGPSVLGAGLGQAALLSLFVWTAAVGHDVAHGLEDVALPGTLRDRLSPRVRAMLGTGFFLASLFLALAYAVYSRDPLFSLATLAGASWTGWLLAALLREPSERNARALRVPGFLYFVLPLVGCSVWAMLR
jgi:4-hydroxybenzoate polyprenyltransferase